MSALLKVNAESELDDKRKRLGRTQREFNKVTQRLAEETDTALTLEEKAKLEEVVLTHLQAALS